MMHSKKKKSVIVGALSLLALTSFTLGNASTIYASTLEGNTDYFIVNPYSTVDWDTYGHYKADFHAHSIESDGGNTPAEMIEDHYAKGFDILALTDHNFTNTTWDRTDREGVEYLTTQRLEEINSGVGRDGRGMVGITYSNEQSRADHLNTFFADFNNEPGATLEENIAKAEELGGISHINHPGRYTGARKVDFEEGEKISTDPKVVGKYIDLFNKYDSLVGMEIINKKDGDSVSDRILWDSILQETMEKRNPVWGFSNDDTHNVNNTGFSYNMMLMPKNNKENVRESMETGTFYAVAKVAKRELGMDFEAQGPTPVIENISVDQEKNSITIKGENYNTIQWIANGQVIATGNTLDLNLYEDEVDSYVRAQLLGDGGISFTQPFGVNEYTIDNLKDSVEELDVNKGVKNSLTVKLDNAKKAVEEGKDNYENLLNAFTNEVEAKSGKEISVDQADNLIKFVDEIILNITSQN
ncbi:PHP domain-containing protein [Clostridium sp. DJ247]|uniref:PHP domain-containing protein n=1 Tax=Clostridium sp. DJ247 TaxID=2726188 RepID=UPI001623DA64|nr:PHP domain-containing protein [Clostridium sp. DJ247]MBC2578776.1 PHP domain-containing protein [Clostridium sp. DJ247]